MTITEIFKTSFETVKSHKKQTLILCVLYAIIQIPSYYIPHFYGFIASAFSAFLTVIALSNFIFKVRNITFSVKHLIKCGLSYSLILTVALILYQSSASLTSFIMYYNGDFYRKLLFLILIFPIDILIYILFTITGSYGIFAVHQIAAPHKAVKLLYAKLSHGFLTKFLKTILISIIINLPISALILAIKYIGSIDLTNSLFVYIISIPLTAYNAICYFTYWNSLEHNLTAVS